MTIELGGNVIKTFADIKEGDVFSSLETPEPSAFMKIGDVIECNTKKVYNAVDISNGVPVSFSNIDKIELFPHAK